MKRIVGEIDLRAWLVAGALLLDLLVLREQSILAIESVACLERAQFETILCVAPPDQWQIALLGALAVALSLTLGAVLASAWRRIV